MPQRTHYDTLGVTADAPAETIKAAYRSLMRKYHPDIAGPSGAAQTLLINAAMSEVGDADRRRSYDRSIRPEPVRVTAPPTAPQPPRQAPQMRPRTPAAEETFEYQTLDDEMPPAVPLMERRHFKASLITAGIGLLILLAATLFLWWRAFLAEPPIGALAGAPLLLVGVALFGTLSEQGRLWPWVMLGATLVFTPVSVVSVGIFGLLIGGGALRLASQSVRNHWRTRPLSRR